LALAEAWQANGLPPAWRDHFRAVAGDCHQYIADAAIKDLRFEEGLDHARKAAALLKLDEAEPVDRVVDRMLAGDSSRGAKSTRSFSSCSGRSPSSLPVRKARSG
jgi:hypothetical protein